MSVVVVGLNRTVPLGLLERMTVTDANLPKALHDLGGRPHLLEAVVLSTCMRTEVYAEAEKFHGAIGDIRNFLAELSGASPESFSDHLYTYYEDAAAAHLFEVAAGLDSAVVGEGEILGQVRDAWERAREEGASGPVLSSLFRHAVEVGKRARTETAISRGVTSVSQAAVAMAADVLWGLTGRTVLVVGAGDMGRGMAVALAGRGVGRVLVASRSETRAAEVVAELPTEARVVEMAEVPAQLRSVDLVLTGTASPSLVFSAEEVAAALAERDGRRLLMVDIAVPRDVDPAVRELPGVTLLDMADLVSFAEAGLSGRKAEVARVREIVEEELRRYGELSTARTVAPVVAALHDRAEALRVAELERMSGRLSSLDERQRRAVEAVTRGLVAKMLHDPTVRLKEEAGTPRGERLADALRTLFDI
ncbi:MAG TPA: glutamyl-tRNA reductase [Acidimicrobiales bacterium]|nr:glutamyl-tRNA reductase [Acidimicrobiales bacterium]